MVNTLTTPDEAFTEVKAMPPCTANWLVPTLLWMVIAWIGSWLVFSQPAVQQQLSDIQNKQFEKMIAQGKMTRQQADQAQAATEKIQVVIRNVGAFVGPVVSAFTSVFWWALLLWLVGNKALGGQFSYMKAAEVAGLSNTLAILESVIRTLLIMTMDSLFAGPNLGLFVIRDFDPTQLSHSLLAVVDVMAIWILGVRTVGLARLAGTSVLKAGLWVYGLYFVCTGFMIGVGQLMQHLFAR